MDRASGREWIDFSGHTDVVPFAEQPGWRYDPLKMQLDGERIYGRGVSDMKVFLAQALVAAKRQKLEQLKRPLVFLLTYDEEVAGQGSGRLVKQLPEAFKEVPLPKVALIGEPTDFEIFPAHKGYASFDIRVHGKAGHSSVPSAGLNAIATMAEVIRIIQGPITNWNCVQRQKIKICSPNAPIHPSILAPFMVD